MNIIEEKQLSETKFIKPKISIIRKIRQNAPARIYERKVDGDTEAHLITIACSEPPKGFAKWSLRLLADKIVELNYVDSLSHETIQSV